MKTKLKIWMNVLLGAFVGMLGYGCDDSSRSGMYGTPTGDLVFKSHVSNEANESLEGVQVVQQGGWKDGAGTMYWERWADTLYTDAEGNVYKLYQGDIPLPYHKVIVNDTTGEYQSDSIITEVKYTGGDGSWNSGRATLDVNFTLSPKDK